MSLKVEARASQPIADMEQDSLLGQFPEGPRLIGTSCDDCGRSMIGSRGVCSNCMSRHVSRIALPTTGVLYSFTRLHVGGDVRRLGYIDLDDVRTLADLAEPGTPLRPGMRVELRVDGDHWLFTPLSGE